jgi:hypothetical protein
MFVLQVVTGEEARRFFEEFSVNDTHVVKAY